MDTPTHPPTGPTRARNKPMATSPLATPLCTPQALTELAVGWLYCERLIAGTDDLLAVGACDQLSRMRVFAEGGRPLVQSEWRRVITSGCGSGHAIDPTELSSLPPVA